MPPATTNLDVDATNPEVIVSAALYLMSTYGCGGGCARLAHVIVKHLRIFAERTDLTPILCSTCANLADQWDITLHNMLPTASAQPQRSNVFTFKRRIH